MTIILLKTYIFFRRISYVKTLNAFRVALALK